MFYKRTAELVVIYSRRAMYLILRLQPLLLTHGMSEHFLKSEFYSSKQRAQ